MTATRREPISQFVQTLDVETRHGDVELRATDSPDGEIVASDPIECHLEGDRLIVRPVRHHADLEIRLPSTVRHVSLFTGQGDLSIDCALDELRARTGRGDVELRGGGRGAVESGHGDVEIEDWNGPLRVSTGAGDVSARDVAGELEIQTGRGDIEVANAPAGARAQTGAGDVRIERAGGACALRTGNGDVEASDLRGADLTIHTGHGDLTIEGSLAGLEADSGHGAIALRAALLTGDFAVSAGHGDVEVELSDDADVRIEAVTGHGRVETSLPLVRVGRPGPAGEFAQRFVGSVGSQNPPASLRVRTNRGRIRIAGGPGEGFSRPTTAEPAARSTEPSLSATERAWVETLSRFQPGVSGPAPTSEPTGPAAAEASAPTEANAGASAEPTPTSPGASAPAEPTPTEARTARPERDDLAILEAVSRGEITVDEALALLSR